MEDEARYIRIFALEFLIEDYRHAIEYRIVLGSRCYQIKQRVHSGYRMDEYLTDWETISINENFHDAFMEIFKLTREMEMKNGLYRDLENAQIPLEIYEPIVSQWVHQGTRLGTTFFSIHGNNAKYPRPSKETKEFYLRVYRSLRHERVTMSITSLWLEELIKKEFLKVRKPLIVNEQPLDCFLKERFKDFGDQVDRYLIDLESMNQNLVVTRNNEQEALTRFQEHLLPEYMYL